MAKKWLEVNYLFDRAFQATVGRLGYFNRYAPGITLVGNSDHIVRQQIEQYVAGHVSGDGQAPRFLDIGARDGVRSTFAQNCDYTGTDINPRGQGIIAADICHCPEIADDSFDIVFSFDVFEHVQQPWAAAAECIRIAKPGGLIVCRTLFAYRYHPEPHDYWRFTSQGLEYLFKQHGGAETLVSGYDVRERRRNRTGDFIDHRPPIDWLGGWRENWQVLWIGRKL